MPVDVVQVSTVQKSPSSQSKSLAQQPAIGLCSQRNVIGLQVSAVHGVPSAHCASDEQQSGAREWKQCLSTQRSIVQLSPSLQSPSLAQH